MGLGKRKDRTLRKFCYFSAFALGSLANFQTLVSEYVFTVSWRLGQMVS